MANPALEALAGELAKLKNQGHAAVALTALISYVDALLASATDPEAERERIRFDFEGPLEQFRSQEEWGRELFKATIEAGQSALRALSVLNGAAAVAVLAFLGNVLAKSESAALPFVPAMNRAMAAFAVGVGLVGAGFAARYLSQAFYGGSHLAETGHAAKWGDRFRNVAVACALSSLLAFFVGVGIAFHAMA